MSQALACLKRLRAGFLLFAFLFSFPVLTAFGAELIRDFLVFPEVNVIHRSAAAEQAQVKRNDLAPAINLFYARDLARLRLLGEVYLSEDEAEIERLQLGWRFTPEHTLWAGRFHSPLGHWNLQYHHGAYVQTSITRPGIHEFEDLGGLLPTHVTGLLLEGPLTGTANQWFFTTAIGAGPTLDSGKLEPFDILSWGSNRSGVSAVARLVFSPRGDDGPGIGAFAGYTRIPEHDEPTLKTMQTIAGLFADWKHGSTHLISEFVWASNRVDSTAGQNRGSFTNAYLQIEQGWRPDWTVYARLEGTSGEALDPYLANFPAFVTERALVGLRYDFGRGQALKLELGDTHLQNQEYRQYVLQWSASFP